ncbi:uncharacterized protein LOC123306473 isoform X2 [Coccinella septempunctata]|uniref:uncharacterized protein LOC123306473 isoform X2 n=1 Tax=Coccinella septempunctata TaxID=41139 RepID=UPI001D07BF8A|nr:uncharacterized protein LOC123306473 isoform X2 [Coccinella septempunctata]
MDTLKEVFNRYENIMDQEIVGVQLGCYSVALIGLSAAIRKVRPFSRFKKPQDIPNRFIAERRELAGYVKRIDPNGALLMVEHKPLISLPIVPRGELPVKILGVEVTGLGMSWLQTVVVNSEVTFIPVKKEKEFIHCKVLLPNIKPMVGKTATRKKESKIIKMLSKRNESPYLNVGENLVRIGFARLTTSDPSIFKGAEDYCKSLHSAELYALKKKLGMKYYWIPVKDILNALLLKLTNYGKELMAKHWLRL